MSDGASSTSVLLVCVSGPDTGKRVRLSSQPICVGRSADCEVASDDPDVAERHINVQLNDGRAAYASVNNSPLFLDGQRTADGDLGPQQQLRIGRSLWQIDAPRASTDFSSFLGSIGDRISEAAGVERIEGFSLGSMLSEVWRKRSDEEMERYFAVGTPATTPPLEEVDTNWPRPWLFVKTFVLAALVYMGFVYALNRFSNPIVIPGLITVGSFVIPFVLLIFFFEVNVTRNVPLYQMVKLLFLGGILSVIVSLFLFEWTRLHESWLKAMSAGIVEETGKAAALLLVVNKLKYRWTLNGMLFGAAVGAGFAAFESAGYAFVACLTRGTNAMFDSITLRGALSICGGHVLWTGLVGAALWRVRGDERFRWEMLKDGRFLRVFGLAVGMHMVWNSPLQMPFHLKYILLGFVAWIALLSYIQSGLRQVQAAQPTGATEFFRRQRLARK